MGAKAANRRLEDSVNLENVVVVMVVLLLLLVVVVVQLYFAAFNSIGNILLLSILANFKIML